jgi:hypothetical protein
MRVGCRYASFLLDVSCHLVLYALRTPMGIGILTVAIAVRRVIPFRVVVMMVIIPLLIGRIIIAPVDTNRGIAAAAGNQDAEAAKDQEDSRHHGVYSS